MVDRQPEEIGSIIRLLREEMRVSQRAFGAALGDQGGDAVSGSAVGEWERGESYPSRRNIFAIERLVGVDEGVLAQHLGYSTDGAARDRLAEITERLDRIEAMLEELSRRRRGAR